MLNRIKQAQKERGCTNKELADVTGTSESTVCRYLKGESDAPFDFVAKAAKHLEISLDEMTGNPAAKSGKDEVYERIREQFEARLEDKREHIASLKARIERLEKAREEDRLHLEEEKKDMRQRMDRKNKIIMRLFIALTVVSMAALYFVVDAYNGEWGLVQYEALLELLPGFGGAAIDTEPAGDFVGLWLK